MRQALKGNILTISILNINSIAYEDGNFTPIYINTYHIPVASAWRMIIFRANWHSHSHTDYTFIAPPMQSNMAHHLKTVLYLGDCHGEEC